MPALSTLIGGVSALTVLTVAVVTLTVTITFSTDALRTVARAHTESLVSLAKTRLEGFLLRPVLATESTRKHYLSGNYTTVGNDPTNQSVTEAMSLIYTVFLNTQGLDEFGVYYSDGSTVLAFPHENTGASVVANVQRGTHLETIPKVYTDNGTRAGPEVAGAFSDPIDYSFYWEAGAWLNTTVDYLSGGRAGLALAEQPFLWVMDPQTDDEYEYWGIGITRAVRNILGHVIGVAYGGIEMSRLSAFLDASRATPNSHIFVIDERGFLLVGTHPVSVTNITIVPDGTPWPGYNCYGTEGESQLVYGGPQYLGCRHHPRDYAWGPLATYAAENGGSIPDTDRVELTLLDGKRYYVGVQWVRPPNTDRGDLGLILVMPESDINGEIIRGRNIAIGVTCGVFVVAVIIAFLTVYMLLTPLRDVAGRMRQAAELERDEGSRERSGITEVRELQESYFALSDELARLSAFVPASVLAARFADVDEADLNSEVAPADTASNLPSEHSRKTGGTGKRSSNKDSSAAGLAAGGGTLNTVASVSHRNVAVLMLNCTGFTVAMRGLSAAQLQTRYSDFVGAIIGAVQDGMGVVDHWNGDRFMVSFNSSRQVSQAATKAARVALAIATQAVPSTVGTPVCIGIAAGRADVGNMGCASAMRFCVLGPVVTAADALCKWVPDYAADDIAEGSVLPAGSRVLVSQHTRSELETQFAMRCLDLRVVIAAAAAGTEATKRVLVTEIVAPRSDKTADEWLYVVGGADKRIENQVFTLLAGGSHDEAHKALAQIEDITSPVIRRAAALLQLPEFRHGDVTKTAASASPGEPGNTADVSTPSPTTPQEQAHAAAHPAAVPEE